MEKEIIKGKNTSKRKERVFMSVIGPKGVGKTYFCKIFKDDNVKHHKFISTRGMDLYGEIKFYINLLDTSGELDNLSKLTPFEIFSACQLFVYIYNSYFPETYDIDVIKQYIEKLKILKINSIKKKKIKT